MSKCQLTKVTPLYDKVGALRKADVAVKSVVEKDFSGAGNGHSWQNLPCHTKGTCSPSLVSPLLIN
jgi:hypothetical protein